MADTVGFYRRAEDRSRDATRPSFAALMSVAETPPVSCTHCGRNKKIGALLGAAYCCFAARADAERPHLEDYAATLERHGYTVVPPSAKP